MFLDNLITRKLILQEAQKMGLDRKKEFLKAIENFWEKSLLKIMVDEKTDEIFTDITVTDEEVEESYAKWVGDKKLL